MSSIKMEPASDNESGTLDAEDQHNYFTQEEPENITCDVKTELFIDVKNEPQTSSFDFVAVKSEVQTDEDVTDAEEEGTDLKNRRSLVKMGTNKQIVEWLNEEYKDNDNSGSNNESNAEEDVVISSVHNSDSEQSSDEAEHIDETETVKTSKYFLGKDNTLWKEEPEVSNIRTRPQNIVLHLAGVTRHSKDAKTHIDCFNLFIDQTIVNIIVKNTNIYIEKMKQKYDRDRDAKHTTEIEIRALFGILYLAGILKSSRLNVEELWNKTGTGIEAIYLSMSYNRFRFLLSCLRFDDIHDRSERRIIDKLAPIREIFEIFIQNSQRAYTSSEYLTIDEQLLAFRGCCSFRMYIPTKPAKCGIKIFAMVDAKTLYTQNLEIYAGTQPEGPFQQSNSAHAVVKRLIHPIRGTGRNVTLDNWFTSIPLALDLLQNDRLTLVGTLRKNKKEIPCQFATTKCRAINSTLFGFTEECTLVSYIPKKNKCILAISTMHHDKAIDDKTTDQQKPEIITFYNSTKCGVDLLDQLCSAYDVSRNSRRWPLTVFFYMLNIAGINMLTVYKANLQINKIIRREFIRTLALSLVTPLITERITKHSIPTEIRQRGRLFLGIQDTSAEHRSRPEGVGRCFMCGRSRNKSTRKSCYQCNKWVCPSHADTVCMNCINEAKCDTRNYSS